MQDFVFDLCKEYHPLQLIREREVEVEDEQRGNKGHQT